MDSSNERLIHQQTCPDAMEEDDRFLFVVLIQVLVSIGPELQMSDLQVFVSSISKDARRENPVEQGIRDDVVDQRTENDSHGIENMFHVIDGSAGLFTSHLQLMIEFDLLDQCIDFFIFALVQFSRLLRVEGKGQPTSNTLPVDVLERPIEKPLAQGHLQVFDAGK